MFHRIFEETAVRSPTALAIKAGQRRLSYAELDAWANEIANTIRGLIHADHGSNEATFVGLCMPRGIEATAGVLGILKAGCAWVPLDPSYPEDRLHFMLEDTAAPVVLTLESTKGAAFLQQSGCALVSLDTALPAVKELRPLLPDDPARAAYVIYTSGSTGRPKGVVGSHAAMLSRFEWMWQELPFDPTEVCCGKTALNFVDSIWEMLGGLLKGIPSVISDEATSRDPFQLLQLLADERITRLILVPSLLAALIEASRATGIRLPQLRYLTSSGELLPSALAQQVSELGDNVTLINLYGSSEMAADATCCIVTPTALNGKIVSIGKPIGRLRVHVLDEHLRPVQSGDAGELCVSGPGLGKYYLGHPDLTAEKFIRNPFAEPGDTEHARLFRSGDMVSMRPDGELDYIGRKDFQIKIRGFRIEPGEIETTLATHPKIRACAVSAAETEGGRQLVAFCVCAVEESVNSTLSNELREFLLTRLPDYMVPSRFIPLDELPRLPNGKLDRNSLHITDDLIVVHEGSAPSTTMERTLSKIWTAVLGQTCVSVSDNFFAIGGDSIQAFRAAARARAESIMLTPADIHDNPTIQDLATLIESRTPVARAWTVPGAVSPLSPMQQYYFSWAKPNPNKFNVGFISRLAEPLDQKLLEGALNAVVSHHDALRLRFTKIDDGSYRQNYIDLADAQRIPIHNILLPAELPELQILFIRREIERLHDTLDITTGPIMTIALFADPRGANHHLFLTMHELVTDALSLQITLEDLRTAYGALAAHKPVVLPLQTTPYHQWVAKVISYAQSPGAVEQLDYWIKDASDALPFPEDSTAEGALQRDIEEHGFEVLDASQMANIRERLSGAAQSTLIHAIVGSLAVTANHLSGQRNLTFHKVAHGREACIRDADPSRTVGWFITHTPITARLPADAIDDNRALAATLEAVSAQYRAIPDNGIGHSALRYYSSDPRAAILARDDKVRTLFQYIGNVWEDNYDGVMFLPPHPSLMDVPDTVAADNLADYHLHVYAYVMDSCFRVKLFYTRPNYRTETILKMADTFTWAMKGMLVPGWTTNQLP